LQKLDQRPVLVKAIYFQTQSCLFLLTFLSV
jgi:hypothetical protein